MLSSLASIARGRATLSALTLLPHSRSATTRPGQPQRLNFYDKGPSALRAPRHIRDLEAERMGASLVGVPEPLGRRPVPESPAAYEASRKAYREAMSAVRKQFVTEWAGRRAREATAAAAEHALTQKKRAEGDAIRGAKRAAALEAQSALDTARRAARAVRRQQGVLSEKRRLAARRASLRHWLRLLEADAKTWVKPDEIDERITPELFALKFAWQWEPWFAAKEAKRQLREDARRTKKAGVPMREVMLPDAAAAYGTDWESEDERNVEGATPAGRAAGAEAALDSSGRVAEALRVARRASKERGFRFLEPGYDADGLPLPVPGSLVEQAAVKAAAAGSAGGVSLAELAGGAPLPDLLARYETWLREQAATLSPATAAIAVHRDSVSGAALADDGERAVENSYIDACIVTNNVEALFYALQRKRARIARGGSAFARASASFEARWGQWLATIERSAGGVFWEGAPEGTPVDEEER